MANQKISALTALTGVSVDTANDVLAIVDTSAATTKKILIDELRIALGIATQAQQEAGTSLVVNVTPGTQQFHPSAAKCWLRANMTGNIGASYNITSITDTGTGVLTVTIATDFSSSDYIIVTSIDPSGGGIFGGVSQVDVAAGSFVVRTFNSSAQTPQDTSHVYAAAFGDQ